ncbi:MAG: hypothetical protein LBB89_07820 [Treponema sp.]|nr:hypothetical protein [Treponema sp.]
MGSLYYREKTVMYRRRVVVTEPVKVTGKLCVVREQGRFFTTEDTGTSNRTRKGVDE